jgi:hypothetical protein
MTTNEDQDGWRKCIRWGYEAQLFKMPEMDAFTVTSFQVLVFCVAVTLPDD